MRTSVLAMIVAGACLCPRLAEAGPREIVVFFTEWSARIDQPADDVIRQAAEMASMVGAGAVSVTGFADAKGSARATELLSRTRAQVVADRLVKDGIDPLRIQVSGGGATAYALMPLESHRVTIGIAMGAQVSALPEEAAPTLARAADATAR